jgi:hypothetical protein
MTMKRMHKLILALVWSARREFVLPGFRETTSAQEILTIEENGRATEIASTGRTFNLVRLVPVTNEREIVGLIAVYDNPVTPGPADYLELRDNEGQIVAIDWIDHFGIRRLTLDRGFLDGNGKFERLFLTLVSGEAI